MQAYTDLQQLAPYKGRCVVTIGNFDGVHRGHQSIAATALRTAAEISDVAVVVTFEPPPVEVLFPERAPARLTTPAEKLNLLSGLGLPICLVLPTDRDLLQTAAEEFLETIADACRPAAIVEGPDFHFGKDRLGTIEMLRNHATRFGYRVVQVPPTRVPELPELQRASSSAARRLLAEGRVEAAAWVLGRAHRCSGSVVRGDKRGASLGFPTANVDGVKQVLPADGVYAALAQIADGSLHAAAVNVGSQPTFDQHVARVEAHLLDFAGDLYEQKIGLHWLKQLRVPTRFDSISALQAQLRRDVAAAREVVGKADREGARIPL